LVTPSGRFHLTREIGRGAEGRVYQASSISSCECRVAVKVISGSRNVCSDHYLPILQLVKHPNILRVVNVEESERYTYIVTELCDKDLFTFLTATPRGLLSEHHAAQLFGQLCRAIRFLHKSGVVHQDIKLENLLIKNDQLKLGDLGSARFIEPVGPKFEESISKSTSMRNGRTFIYLCPELLTKYPNKLKCDGRQADIWAMGITLFVMVSGCLPWQEASPIDENFSMYASSGSLRKFLPQTVSGSLVNLLEGLLCINPLERLDSFDVLEHSWFSTFIYETSQGAPMSCKEHETLSCGKKRSSCGVEGSLSTKKHRSHDIQ